MKTGGVFLDVGLENLENELVSRFDALLVRVIGAAVIAEYRSTA